MRLRFLCYLIIPALSLLSTLWGYSIGRQSIPKGGDQPGRGVTRVPSEVILVKGAWSSASDSVTPVPEGGSVVDGVFKDEYFGTTYVLPPNWTEKYTGPPPSETGRYVLAQLSPASTFKGPAKGSILITAQDLFFSTAPATNATELMNYMKGNLESDYKVETPPKQIKIAGRSFTFFAYWSPAAQLYWYVLATQIRCHVVQVVLSSRDTNLLEDLMLSMNQMKLPAESGSIGKAGRAVPLCVKDYARDENMITRVDPVFTEHRFNPVPVRITINKEGKVRHIHFLSAFPDQSKSIADALSQWRFKQYRRDGQQFEVETGILFGRVNPR
jgi:hypothetical protein